MKYPKLDDSLSKYLYKGKIYNHPRKDIKINSIKVVKSIFKRGILIYPCYNEKYVFVINDIPLYYYFRPLGMRSASFRAAPYIKILNNWLKELVKINNIYLKKGKSEEEFDVQELIDESNKLLKSKILPKSEELFLNYAINSRHVSSMKMIVDKYLGRYK